VRIIDVSRGIHPDMATWPGDPGVEVLPASRIAEGDPANVSELRLGTHTGTHIDPPVHFLEGAGGADGVPLEPLVGEAVVADLRGTEEAISAADLEALDLPPGTERLLMKTHNQERPPGEGEAGYAALAADTAAWALERGLRLVGTDSLSIEYQGNDGFPVHTGLLEAGVVIVEGLDLSDVEPGSYRLVCLPLRLLDGDGAPARAILIAEDG
jgi:arylformamidase